MGQNKLVVPPKQKLSLGQVINAGVSGNSDNNDFLDDIALGEIFGTKVIDDLDDPDPELDNPKYVLGEQKIDSKVVMRKIEPLAPHVCKYCAFNFAKFKNIDLTNATPEQLEKAKPIFERAIAIHSSIEHKGLNVPKIISERDLIRAQRGQQMNIA